MMQNTNNYFDLFSRHQFPSTPQPTPIPAWQRAPVNQEATPTKAPPTNHQTSPGTNPPITGTQGEENATQNGNALSNSSESVNHEDALANSSIDNEDAGSLNLSNGKGKGDQSVNQNELANQNGDMSVEAANDEN